MALEFTETAPGVHTATLSDPKTGQGRNIAIIESCDAWQLFVDGEMTARDLPSFAAAVEQGKKAVGGRPSKLFGVPGLVVLGSLTGALAIGSAALTMPFWIVSAHGDAAPAALAKATTKAERIAPRSDIAPSPYAKSPAPSKPSLQKVAIADDAKAKPATATIDAPENAAAADDQKQTWMAETPQSPEAASPAAPKPPVRRFSAQNPVLGIIATVTKATPTAKAETKSAEPFDVALLKKAPSSPAAPTLASNPPIISETADNEPKNDATQPDELKNPVKGDIYEANDETLVTSSTALSPPLPAPAPRFARPTIRPVTASISPVEPVVTQEREQAKNDPTPTKQVKSNSRIRKLVSRTKAVKRTFARNKAKSTRNRIANKDRPERRVRNRPRRIRTADNYRSSNARQMVCFASTCRWR